MSSIDNRGAPVDNDTYLVDRVWQELLVELAETSVDDVVEATPQVGSLTERMSQMMAEARKLGSNSRSRVTCRKHCCKSSTKDRPEDDLPCMDALCRRCGRQILRKSTQEIFGDDMEHVSREEFQSRATTVANDILNHYSFCRSTGPLVIDGGVDLSADQFAAMIELAFPSMVTDEQWDALMSHRLISSEMRQQLGEGLLISQLRACTKSAETFFRGIFRHRLAEHPGHFVALDNAALQLGWGMHAFKLTMVDCFVRIGGLNAKYCEVLERSIGGLHSHGVFHAARGMVILRSQSMLYKGFALLTAHLAPSIMVREPSQVPIPEFTPHPPLQLLLERLDQKVLPALDKFLESYKQFLPTFKGSGLRLRQEILAGVRAQPHEKRKKWLPFVLLAKTSIRTSILMLVHLLRQDLTALRRTIRDYTKDRTTISKVLRAWAGVENGLFYLVDSLSWKSLRIAMYEAGVYEWLLAHEFNFNNIVEKWLGSDCFRNPAISGIAALTLGICTSWPLKEKLLLIEQHLPMLPPHLTEVQRDYMMPIINIFLEIINALEILQPCGVGIANRDSQLCSNGNSSLATPPTCFTHLAEVMPKGSGEDVAAWIASLWKEVFDGLEMRWTSNNMDNKVRSNFRQLLGLPKPLSNTEPQTSKPVGAKDGRKKVDRHDASLTSLLGEVVQPVGTPASTTAQSAAARAARLLQNFEFATPTSDQALPETPRPSQFAETRTFSSKTPKRRHLATPSSDQDAAPDMEPATSPSPQPAKQKLIFKDKEMYHTWRQIFPLPGTKIELQPMRWDDLRRVINSEPLNFIEVRSSGVEFRWRRLQADGYQQFELGAHRPHNAKVEKNLLMHFRKNLRVYTGWEAEDFGLEGEE